MSEEEIHLDIPDTATTFFGYRAFSLSGDLLCSTAGGGPWLPGVNQAFCTANTKSMGDYDEEYVLGNVDGKPAWVKREDQRLLTHGLVPSPMCSCGFWLLKSFEALNRLMNHKSYIYAQVEVWGRVVVTTEGYRAEKARITKVYPWNDTSPPKSVLQRYEAEDGSKSPEWEAFMESLKPKLGEMEQWAEKLIGANIRTSTSTTNVTWNPNTYTASQMQLLNAQQQNAQKQAVAKAMARKQGRDENLQRELQHLREMIRKHGG